MEETELARSLRAGVPAIVFNIASDPVKIGLAKSLAHPGGSATGISMMTATLTVKRLELIRELLPQRDRRLLGKPGKSRLVAETEGVARSTGQSLSLVVANARPA